LIRFGGINRSDFDQRVKEVRESEANGPEKGRRFMERITENVYALTTIRGCNPGYVVTSAGMVVIDTPQLPTAAVAMREEVLERGVLRFLVNTENHIDHIFGNHYFAGMCPVVGHEDILTSFWSSVFGDPYDSMVDIVKRADPQGVALIPQKKDYIDSAAKPLSQDRENLPKAVENYVWVGRYSE
jgi:glyoxylase-like metal-dependent hydrolase (beta-lactamase superfamily II)